MFGIIYCFENIITKKKYIGKTINLKQRIIRHYWDAFDKKLKLYFHCALRKYGKNNFKIKILEKNIKISNINSREKFWIKKLKTNNRIYGYNETSGGDGCFGRKVSKETKLKIGLSNFGKRRTKTAKQKMSN